MLSNVEKYSYFNARKKYPTHVKFNAKYYHSRSINHKHIKLFAINLLSRRGKRLRPCADETGSKGWYHRRVTRRVAQLGALKVATACA
jgi:hypothetical protein